MGHNAEGGTLYHGISSVSKCAEFCMKIPECVAFDFDKNDPPFKNARCWIHENSKCMVKKQALVDHYSRNVCSDKDGKIV